MREIPLSNRDFCVLVDDEDYEWLSEFTWRAHSSNGITDSCAMTNLEERKNVRMHRMIMNAKPGEEVDHKNGKKFDNQRSNLRICSRSQNGRNVHGRWGQSKYIGVSQDWRRGTWNAYINLDGKRTYIGAFETEEEAAKARDIKAKELHKEYANLNFPKEL